MSSLNSDNIALKHRKELAELRGAQRGVLSKILFCAAGVFLIVMLFSALLGDSSQTNRELAAARQNFAASGLSWSSDFLQSQEDCRQWLQRHGTGGEERLFNGVSEILFRSAAALAAERESRSLAARLYVSIHFGILRGCFLLLACWRLWTAAIVLAVLAGYFGWRPYRSRDLLGQTGNDRLFYSGIRAGLNDVDSRGRPRQQVTGLACPRTASPAAARTSPLGQLLQRYNVANETNLALTAILVQHDKWPAYVAERDEQDLLDAAFSGCGLADNAVNILQSALSLHALYLKVDDPAESSAVTQVPATSDKEDEQNDFQPDKQMSSSQYAVLLGRALHRVLTPHLTQELASLPPQQIATIILAHEAGKVMTYAFEGGRWLRRSSFGQLCARAVLHAIPSFVDEYDVDSRATIRRSIIYASRRSSFAPVQFPLDFSEPCRAARQWTELLMACPHELQATADEVELVARVTEAHRAWSTAFLDGVMTMSAEVVDGVIATHSNSFFVPLGRVLKLMRRVLQADEIQRIETLVALVSQKQKLQAMSLDLTEEGRDGPKEKERQFYASYDKILPPFSYAQSKELAERFKLPLEDVRDWSALRVVLNSFGWLARRVGDYTVPESSLIFAVFKAEEPGAQTNELGLFGRPGMVPLRATRVAMKLGRFWSSRFVPVNSASMAETEEDYQRLLKGIEEPAEEDGTTALG